MENIDKLLNIQEIDETTNFWMVRAKRGFFFDEYIRNQFVAIGWNSIKESRIKGNISKEQVTLMKEEIQQEYGEKNPGTALNKCLKFYNEVKVGDIAMIVDRNRIAFAVIGDYYEENNPDLTVKLEIQTHQDIESARLGEKTFSCPYIKRRKIKVIRVIPEDTSINPYLYKAMAVNRHSLSDLKDYTETILSTCFDSFLYKGKLTITFRVNQRDDINALVLADFVSSSARIISNNNPDLVTVKTTIHSPGDILLQITNYVMDNIPLVILCMAIFGGKVGEYEFNSLIDVVKGVVNRKYEKDKKELELRKLTAETKLVEQDVIAKQLENAERQKNIQIKMVDEYVGKLAYSANRLDIQSNISINDINEIINAYKTI